MAAWRPGTPSKPYASQAPCRAPSIKDKNVKGHENRGHHRQFKSPPCRRHPKAPKCKGTLSKPYASEGPRPPLQAPAKGHENRGHHRQEGQERHHGRKEQDPQAAPGQGPTSTAKDRLLAFKSPPYERYESNS